MPLDSTPSPSQPRPLALSLALYAALYLGFALAVLLAPPSQRLAPIFVSALCGSVVAIVLVWSFSDRRCDDRSLRNLIFCGMVADLLFNFTALKLKGTIGTPTAGITPLSLLCIALTGLGNLGVLAAAIGVGLFLGRGMKSPAYLVLAAIAGAVADIVSVYAGPSKHISVSALFDYLSFQWGILGHGGVQPIIGAGDFIFLTLFFFGSRRFGLDDRRTLGAMILAIAVGFVVTLSVGAVPALPFMAVALLFTHGRALHHQIQANRNSA